MIVSGGQRRDSAVHTHASILPHTAGGSHFQWVVRKSFTDKVAFENQGLTESGMKAVGELGKGQQQVQGS